MKKIFCIGLLMVLALSGCEEGMTSDDGTGTSGDGQETGFSFSDMYSRMNALQEEVDRLKQVNDEQEITIQALSDGSSSSIGGLVTRIDDLESTVGDASSGLVSTVNSHGTSIGTLVSTVGNASSGLVSTVNSHGTSIDNLNDDLLDLNSTFTGVTRLTDPNTGQPTIQFSGVNVQIVSGSGYTNGVNTDFWTDGTVNGLGNLIVGYNEIEDSGDNKSGSHNIIVGSWNNYPSYGGLVAGSNNTISGKYSSVSGGFDNIAEGLASSVSGGDQNTASANASSVSGGRMNTAGGIWSSVSGGDNRSVTGNLNWAAGDYFQHQ
ncbi:MAG: hypothetical protein GY754_10370 [bacterium]|nr:hypothetical protein [bacterium]